jgi:hypothetical protein
MMMHFITTLPKLKRVRVIAARCETSSHDMLMHPFGKKEKPYKAPVADTI